MHTEKTLKTLTKAQLLEIAAANEIQANETMKNDDIKALILLKGCPITSESGTNSNTNPADTENDTETTASAPADDNAPKFTKEQILASRWFSHRRDSLTVMLSDDKQYSHGEVDRLLVEFMKGKVN